MRFRRDVIRQKGRWWGAGKTFIVSLFVLTLAAVPDLYSRTEIILTGEKIPIKYAIGSHFIFHNSDSLYLNGKLLERDRDYSFNNFLGEFDLTLVETKNGDTLLIRFTKLPQWIEQSYGRTLPETTTDGKGQRGALKPSKRSEFRPGFSEVSVSGTKSFSFSARSVGSSEFNQSIDLKISGQLSPGLEINGAVSDRGYDPSYGTANSRLSELDKINLTLKSRTLTARIGDITLMERFGSENIQRKQVSGASLDLHNRSWFVNAAAARPKGRYKTIRFQGQDGTQGPYQIGEGNISQPIVPGSETVWLDGDKLEIGSNKDYTVDYPTGRITFNENHPIDSRRRIEVDYEPLATDYKGELFMAGGGVALLDSSIFASVTWYREGDDKNQPLTGDLSEIDLDILEQAGDDQLAAYRTGVVEDSSGSYVLLTEFLPDSVYGYAGLGNGAYDVSFSYVGSSQGDYRFLGASNYEYAGKNQGEYLPVVIIAAPERTDYYNARVGIRDNNLGNVMLDIRQTEYDRNLVSSQDDDDNSGLYYNLQSEKVWQHNNRINRFYARVRKKDVEYKTRDRLYETDFNRRYLLPEYYIVNSDETLYDLAVTFAPSGFFLVKPFYSHVEYKDDFKANTGGLTTEWHPFKRLTGVFSWKTIVTDLDSAGYTRWGDGDVVTSALSWQMTSRWQMGISHKYDNRTNNYGGLASGTRYNSYQAVIDGKSEKVTLEYYVEDTLLGDWQKDLKRFRLTSLTNHRLGDLAYNLRFTYQKLNENDLIDENYLGRLNYQYHSFANCFDLSGSYSISEETRNARGINYLEVEQGEGNYIYENGQYIPDPDGNFIKVEEILSDQRKINRGEKTFHFGKDFTNVLLKFNATIKEELLPEGERNLWWIIPFISDKNEAYLYYSRRYHADVRMFSFKAGHRLNLTFDEDVEIRDISGQPQKKHDRYGSVVLKQVHDVFFFEEKLELFRLKRDDYYSGAGDVDGYKIDFEIKRQAKPLEISAGGYFRQAESDENEKSEIYAADFGLKLRFVKRGEIRSTIEMYNQKFTGVDNVPTYSLTDNKPGEKGAIWSVNLNYGLKKEMRMNFSVSGRHADNRTARITARGEFIAGF